ncbi:MAG: hypothetical protein OK439_07725 [Thaumarchaeota archaeon]|nr:hypothetical protein [Nitrososphaerota archaeon]
MTLPSINIPDVQITREAKVTLYRFTDFFSGFENVPVIRELFGKKTDEILANLKIEFYSAKFGYMSVSDEDGHLIVSAYHLRTADQAVVYLDVVHELHHVKQFMDGKKIFLMEFEYVDSPIEIEAYIPTVEEARRIGMSDEEIREYLKIEWISDEQFERLVSRLGL